MPEPASTTPPGNATPKAALVTGGTGHLGRHVVSRLLSDDVHVHVPVFRSEELAGLESALGDDVDRVQFHAPVDLGDPVSVESVFEGVEAREGHGPDILVNLAGGFTMAPVEDTASEAWEHMLRINATTAFLCSRQAFPSMKTRGWGRIVNVSAFPALDRGAPELSAYGAAKAAVLNLTQTLAKEGRGDGITVNAVLPSIIDTPPNRKAQPDADTSTWLPPSEIAEVISFLVSDRARIVNGAAVTLTV